MASNHSSYKYSTVGRWLPQEPLETAAVVINPRCITANLRNRQADDSDVAFDLKLWWPIRIRIGLIKWRFMGKTHWHRTKAFSPNYATAQVFLRLAVRDVCHVHVDYSGWRRRKIVVNLGAELCGVFSLDFYVYFGSHVAPAGQTDTSPQMSPHSLETKTAVFFCASWSVIGRHVIIFWEVCNRHPSQWHVQHRMQATSRM